MTSIFVDDIVTDYYFLIIELSNVSIKFYNVKGNNCFSNNSTNIQIMTYNIILLKCKSKVQTVYL